MTGEDLGQLTRREFLAGSGAIVVTAGLGGCVSLNPVRNYLDENGKLYLIDFGLSKILNKK